MADLEATLVPNGGSEDCPPSPARTGKGRKAPETVHDESGSSGQGMSFAFVAGCILVISIILMMVYDTKTGHHVIEYDDPRSKTGKSKCVSVTSWLQFVKAMQDDSISAICVLKSMKYHLVNDVLDGHLPDGSAVGILENRSVEVIGLCHTILQPKEGKLREIEALDVAHREGHSDEEEDDKHNNGDPCTLDFGGVSGVEDTIIAAKEDLLGESEYQSESGAASFFAARNNLTNVLRFANLKIVNGLSHYGNRQGFMQVWGGTVEIENCTFSGIRAFGGVISNMPNKIPSVEHPYNTTVMVKNSTFKDNHGYWGGAFRLSYGTFDFQDSSFIGNMATYGGSGTCWGGAMPGPLGTNPPGQYANISQPNSTEEGWSTTCTFNNSKFLNNWASQQGTSIIVAAGATVHLLNTSFANNEFNGTYSGHPYLVYDFTTEIGPPAAGIVHKPVTKPTYAGVVPNVEVGGLNQVFAKDCSVNSTENFMPDRIRVTVEESTTATDVANKKINTPVDDNHNDDDNDDDSEVDSEDDSEYQDDDDVDV